MVRDRERLIARIRQIRRVAAAAHNRPARTASHQDAPRIEDLAARLGHLEQLVEGLQDSVHRESERQGKLIAELQAQVQPAAMHAALDQDARDRGL
jgi:hypothetical protein